MKIQDLDLAIEFMHSGLTMKEFGNFKEDTLCVKSQCVRQRIIKSIRRAISNSGLDRNYCYSHFGNNNWSKSKELLQILNIVQTK